MTIAAKRRPAILGVAMNDFFFPSPNDLTYILSPARLPAGLMGWLGWALLGEPDSVRLLSLLINLPDGQGAGDVDEAWLSGLRWSSGPPAASLSPRQVNLVRWELSTVTKAPAC